MNRIAFISAIAVTLSASVAVAAPTWSGDVYITAIEKSAHTISGDADTYLIFASTPTGKPTCATNSQGLIFTTAAGEIAMTSIATAAFLAGKPVRVYWDDNCSTGSTFGRIIGIQMR